MEMKIKFDIKEVEEMLAEFNLEPGGKVQQAIDGAVADFCIPYCPYRTGKLAHSPYSSTLFGSGVIEYGVPYASYMYYGVINGKEVHYNTAINPLAGSYWDRRMKADRMGDIVAVAKKAMSKHGV